MRDPWAPAVAGVGQWTRRPEGAAADRSADGAPETREDVIGLMARAVAEAGRDVGGRRALLDRVDTLAVVNALTHPGPDVAGALARRLGLEPRRQLTTTIGGNSPQLLVDAVATSIARGESSVALVVGGETLRGGWRKTGAPPGAGPGAPGDTVMLGDGRPGSTKEERAHSAGWPLEVFPLFESALRARAERGVEEHQRMLGELWSELAAVSASNPHAWSRRAFSPAEISEPGPDNRVAVFPYTKRMCANPEVDQASALLLCSVEEAEAAGIPSERLVYPHAGGSAGDHHYVTERWSLAESPAIQALGRAILAVAGLGVDDVARFDLYSCFPSAVQVALDALGLRGPLRGDDRPITLTGGLPFAGGPGNNYMTHAIAAAVVACRDDPGSFALVTGLGWHMAKHSAGVYSTTAPPGGFKTVDGLQPALDALPRRVPAGLYEGPATVESTCVRFSRDGSAVLALLSCLTPDGRRALANTSDAELLGAMTRQEWAGRPVRLCPDGSRNMLGDA